METSLSSDTNVLENLNQLDVALAALRSRIMEVKIDRFGEVSDHETNNDVILNNDVTTDEVTTSTAKDETDTAVSTFFTTREVDFGDLKAEIRTVDGRQRIPLKMFLTACVDYTQFFERLGSSNLMGTIKGDINGNIEKIKKNCSQEDYNNVEFLLVSYFLMFS